MLTTSISLPLEMLQAGITYSRVKGQRQSVQVRLCGRSLEPVKALGGISLTPESILPETGPGDLIIVPGLWRNPLPVVKRSPELIQWLQEQHQAGAVFCVVGTGVAFLAEAGLLNHQPAATHWFFMDRLKQHYPDVDFKPHHLITQSGSIYCAGSVNSVADLMVHLIGLAWGEPVAYQVEQQFSHEIRRPFEQTHFSEDHTTTHQDEVIIDLQSWIQKHYNDDVQTEQLMQRSGLTRRTLNRRFKEATGMSPNVYIQKLRLSQASELLKNTDLSIYEIALQTGYSDPEYFSRIFKKQYQLTPSDFKRSVRGKLFYLNDV